MKTIKLEDGLNGCSVQVRICTREELTEYINTHCKNVKEDTGAIQTLYLWNADPSNEGGKDHILFVVDNGNKDSIVSSVMKILFNNVMNELLSEAEDGNILPEEEIDKISFGLANSLNILLKEV